MIKFELPESKTFHSFFEVSFSSVKELEYIELQTSQNSFIMLAIKADMMIEELNHITDNLPEPIKQLELTFESFEGLERNTLYIFD